MNRKQETFNSVNENIKALASLFPSAVKDGQVDFEALKEELGQFEEVEKEKYELMWSGKQNAKKQAQQEVLGKTLKYVPEDSKNPETTENLYIEGDNLEVLKLLRQDYYSSIRIIYIDPPYNTGNDFVYNDNFSMAKGESDIAEGNTSDLGERCIANKDTNNKCHANWLNMIYPRLKIARDLLTDDGVIFISIDDSEQDSLKKICNEIFGEENFVGTFLRKTSYGEKTAKPKINRHHEYLYIYSKNISTLSQCDIIHGKKKTFSDYSNPDNDPNGDWKKDSYLIKIDTGRQGLARYKITNPYLNITHYPPVYYNESNRKQWHYVEETFNRMVSEGRVVFYKTKEEMGNSEYSFFIKKYKKDVNEIYNNLSTIEFIDNDFINAKGTDSLKTLFADVNVFSNSYPKPLTFIKKIITSIKENENSIILDFFSGSSTTAHAVMQLNAEDGGNRKFIMVQLPEETSKESEAYKAGYKNICEIGKERIRRAGEKIKEENKDKEGIEGLDIGFKVFRVEDSENE